MSNPGSFKLIVYASFAVFAMFFGAGNLIFPVSIGVLAKGDFVLAILGLFITAVILPCVAIIVPMLRSDLLLSLGKPTSFIILTMTALLIGPIGAIPRCVTFSFAGMEQFFTLTGLNVSAEIFGMFFLLLSVLLVRANQSVVEIIGKWLSPALILGLVLMFFIVLLGSEHPLIDSSYSSLALIGKGVSEGYNTMDVLTGIFFYKLVLDYIKGAAPQMPDSRVKFIGVISAVLGLLILAVIYAALVYTGAVLGPELDGVLDERLFIEASSLVFGGYSAVMSGLLVMFACLTTVVALIDLSAKWAQHCFNGIFSLSYASAVWIIFAMSYAMTLLGFGKLVALIASVLYLVYPALIVVNIAALCGVDRFVALPLNRLFWVVLVLTIVYYSFIWLS